MTKPRCFLAETMQILFRPQGQTVRSIRPTDSSPDLRGTREQVGGGWEKKTRIAGAIRVRGEIRRDGSDGPRKLDFLERLDFGAGLMALYFEQTGAAAEHAVELVHQQ